MRVLASGVVFVKEIVFDIADVIRSHHSESISVSVLAGIYAACRSRVLDKERREHGQWKRRRCTLQFPTPEFRQGYRSRSSSH